MTLLHCAYLVETIRINFNFFSGTPILSARWPTRSWPATAARSSQREGIHLLTAFMHFY
jgi:hypothetical protein